MVPGELITRGAVCWFGEHAWNSYITGSGVYTYLVGRPMDQLETACMSTVVNQ